jgi:hypothetical protein
MKNFVVENNTEFIETLWNLRSSHEDQIILSIENDVNHHFAIRLFHKKFIWITSNNEVEKKNYLIDIIFNSTFDGEVHQTDSFQFIGHSSSTYLFSNLIFKAVIPSFPKLTEIKEFSFLNISNQSNITFLNCEFVNDIEKIYKIEAWYDTVVEFINCEFIGNFKFETHDGSVILM